MPKIDSPFTDAVQKPSGGKGKPKAAMQYDANYVSAKPVGTKSIINFSGKPSGYTK